MMRFVRNCGFILTALSAASVARADLSISFKPVPISAGAKADDAQLQDTATNHPLARTFEVDITQSKGEQWTVATMQTTLDNGSFYAPAAHDSPLGQESLWDTVGARQLQNDTFVTTPHGGTYAQILGLSDFPANRVGPAIMPGTTPAGFTPTVTSSTKTIDISWGDQTAVLHSLPDGTYPIARFTTMGMASGTILGHFSGSQHIFTDVKYAASIPVPKPFDFNGDGSVNAGDINDAITVVQGDISDYLAEHLQDNLDASYATSVGDLNGDGAVNKGDVADYVYVLQSQGVSASEIAPLAALAPEPASFLLIGLTSVGYMSRRRKN